ncbi:hypothetical protein QQ054_14005 [Oscillatoria amoena NRMC-F 0135]|nr:hypothetical protein [Oscillatoria amoena NRMC-F 0135]
MQAQWAMLQNQIAIRQQVVKSLADQDDHTYRVILDLPALSAEQRMAGAGGVDKNYAAEVQNSRQSMKHIRKLTG